MTTPRTKIDSKRAFERFLRSRGFSQREAVILARAWPDIERFRAGAAVVEADR